MAAGTWTIYAKAKKNIGNGVISLATATFKMQLYGVSASATIIDNVNRGLTSSILGELATAGGYTAGGKALTGLKWTLNGTGGVRWAYTTTGVVISGALTAVKYGLISVSTVTGGKQPVCYCALTTTPVTVTTGNTLTVQANVTSGVFTMS